MVKCKHGSVVPYPLAEELRKNYGSDFKHIAMAVNRGDHLLAFDNKKLKETGGYFEKEASEMFNLEMLKGQAALMILLQFYFLLLPQKLILEMMTR